MFLQRWVKNNIAEFTKGKGVIETIFHLRYSDIIKNIIINF